MATNSLSQTSPTLLGRLGQFPADQEAWEKFVERYGPKIYLWCQQWKLQKSDAEDVTQNVLLRLANHMARFSYDPSKSFRGWLKVVTRNAWTDLQTSHKPGSKGTGDPDVLRLLTNVEARDDLSKRIEAEFDSELLEEASGRVRLQVTQDKWEVFRLLAVEGLPGEEVARRVNMKLATVYVVRSKVQKLLQAEIELLDIADKQSVG